MIEGDSETRRIGAYGIRFQGVEDARALLVPARAEWPTLAVESRHGDGEATTDWLTEHAATMRLQHGGEIVVERSAGRVTFVLPRPLRTHELVHPLLAPVGGVMAYWLGRESFHAGAFVHEGRAWAILGERGAGKSTAVGWLALNGLGVVCDDLLVLEAGTALAGPRSVDLREEAAKRLGAGESLGLVGARERWRLPLGPVESGLPLGGCVFLAWGERVEAVRLPVRERLPRLHAQRGVMLPPRDPAALLDLAALPAWELRRPSAWDSLAAATDCLLETLA